MLLLFKFSMFVTSILHLLFFKLESIDFMKESTLKIFGVKTSEAQFVYKWAFNQGFYNLFLALGLLVSLFYLGTSLNNEAIFLARYILIFIVGAGLVLLFSSPKKKRGALIQALPALLGFVLSYCS